MVLRKDTIKEIKGLVPVLSVEEGGTGGNSVASGRKGLGFDDLGFGLATMPVITGFDWQQADFTSGACYCVNPTVWANPPAGIAFHSTVAAVFINVIGSVYTNTFDVLVTPNTDNNANFKEYRIRFIGVKGSRIFSVRQIFTSAESIPVSNGGTGGTTVETGRKGLGFEDLGFGMTTQNTAPPFDWQQADFASGQTYLVNVTGWLNAPLDLKNPAGDVVSIICEIARTTSTRFVVHVVSQSTTATARFTQRVVIYGAKGSRQFGVVQEYNSDPTTVIPFANGGTGGKTLAEARTNLQVDTRAIVGDINLNTIGPYQEGNWSQSSVTYATLANNYPAVERGILEVYRGGRNNGTQRYTTDGNRIFIRFLGGSWNGADGPWSDWIEVGGLSSPKVLVAGGSLHDYAYFSQNTTYVLSGARTDLPVGISTNCTIMSIRRAGGTIAALSQMLYTNVGVYYRVGSPDTATNWTTITWYAGGDANGWRLIGVEALRAFGIGHTESPLISNFDWQQADFPVGSYQTIHFGSAKNGPAELVFNPTTSVTLETVQSRSILTVVRVTALTMSLGNKNAYFVTISGNKGERIYQVTQNFNSDTPVPLSGGGTGGKTASEARVNLELNTRKLADDKNINELGASLEGRWARSTTGSTMALGFPEENAAGTLEVFAGGSFGCTQIFTSRSGITYVRYLTNTWNGTNGPWSDWLNHAEESPLPDMWLPFNDDIRFITGVAPRDKITVGEHTIELPSKSPVFTRASTATYIAKTGLLTTAAINEPRFERDGLLIEGQSTNTILNSDDPTKWATYNTLTREVIVDGFTQATTLKATVNAATSSNHLVVNSNAITVAVGDMITLSARIKATSDKIRLRFTIDSSEVAQCFFDGLTGSFISSSASIKCTSTPLGDGYSYITAVFTSTGAGLCSGNIWFNGALNIPIGAIIYVQTVQCEKNPVATSYIPTGAAAVTRSTELLTIPALGNVGYRIIEERFSRTVAFEVSVEGFIPPVLTGSPTVNYVDIVRTRNVTNDIFMRVLETSVRSYRAGGGPIINITPPFARKTYVQTTNTSNTVTMFMDGQSNNGTGGPVTTGFVPTTIEVFGHMNVVYHIRNFRIWHKVLTEAQIKGIR